MVKSNVFIPAFGCLLGFEQYAALLKLSSDLASNRSSRRENTSLAAFRWNAPLGSGRYKQSVITGLKKSGTAHSLRKSQITEDPIPSQPPIRS